MTSLLPRDVVQRRLLTLVDIRPLDERRGILGFLPGSMGCPLDDLTDAQRRLDDLARALPGEGIVLHCTSGHRSARVTEALRARLSTPLFDLDRGLLGWAGDGLPVCRPMEPPSDRPRDLLELRRHLLACLVATYTEASLDQDRHSLDPGGALRDAFLAVQVSWDAPTVEGMYRVLDRVAIGSFRARVDLRSIAENLELMYGMLAAFEDGERR